MSEIIGKTNDGAGIKDEVFVAGKLQYTKLGLISLFAWLCWGAFCFNLFERVTTTLLPLQLRSIGASTTTMAVIMTVIPGILGMLIGAPVSYKSDRCTHRWGRRRPFIIYTMPFLCLFMVSLGFTEDLADFIRNWAFLKQYSYSPYVVTLAVVGFLVFGYRVFNEFVDSVWWYLFRDVVPEKMLARFMGLTRIMGITASLLWSIYVFPHVETHAKEIYIVMCLLYLFGFGLMCWRVKEERHEPTEEEAAELKPSVIQQVRNYTRECFGHPIYIWHYVGSAFDYFGNGLTFLSLLFAKQLGISFQQLGIFYAVTSLVDIIAAYPCGWFADRFHPVRLKIVVGAIAMVSPLLGYFFYQDWPSFMLLGLLWLVPNQVSQAAGSVLGMRIFPKKRYGQFASCDGLVKQVAKMLGALAGAAILDRIQDYRFYLIFNGGLNSFTILTTFVVYYYWKKLGADNYVAPLKDDIGAPVHVESIPAAPSVAGKPRRVLDWSDYKLFISCAVVLVSLVTALVMLMSFFKQKMSADWLSDTDVRTRTEIRQYVAILAEESEVQSLQRRWSDPQKLPPLFIAMAMAAKGEEGRAILAAEMKKSIGERRVAILAGLEYERPGTLLPMLQSPGDLALWADAAQAAALADTYSSVDFVWAMDNSFIALFPGKKAIDAKVLNDYQRTLIGLFNDPDRPDVLSEALAFHADYLKGHPELYKSGVLQKHKDSWESLLKRTFEQRSALRANQEAVRTVMAGNITLPPSALQAANHLLLARRPGNPVTLVRTEWPDSLPAGESLIRREDCTMQALARSADGAVWASGGFDNNVRVWNAGKEGEPRVLAGHAFGVLAVAVSPDGTRVASAGMDGTIRLWDAATGQQKLSIDAGTRRVSALAFSPDGTLLSAGGSGGSIRLLDADHGAERRVLRCHRSEVTALAFTANGKQLIAGSLDRTLTLWGLEESEATPVILEKHGDAVWSFASADDGKWMGSGSGDRRVMLWNLQDKRPKPITLKAHKSTVMAVTASADGTRLVSAGADGLVVVRDTTARGKLLGAHPTDARVTAMQFDPDGQSLIMACVDGSLRRWKVAPCDERPFSFLDWLLWLLGKD